MLLFRLDVMIEPPDTGNSTNGRLEVGPKGNKVLETGAERDLEGVSWFPGVGDFCGVPSSPARGRGIPTTAMSGTLQPES